MMVKKLNIVRLAIVVIIIGVLLFYGIKFVNDMNYKKTNEYKLTEIGYTKEEVKILENNLKPTDIDSLLKSEKNEILISLLNEKYFIYSKLDSYLNYYSENKQTEAKNIVSIINTESNLEWTENKRETDISKNELMLVNRIYGLKEDYQPESIILVSQLYAYSGKRVSKAVYDPLISLIEDAKTNGHTLVVDQGFRSYKDQNSIYESYKESLGIRETDKFVARPGHSEYQTGMSVNLVPYNKVIENYKESEEYLWLKENAHKHGFIMRLPEGKESITGFKADPWRIRYVGPDASDYIYNNDITLEEYYAFYILNQPEV